MNLQSIIWSFTLICLALCLERPSGRKCPEGEGKYSVGCNNQYLECVNGREYERHCPAGLYFDRITSACQTKQQNYLCENGNDRQIRQKAVEIDCREDGEFGFSSGCYRFYYQCANRRSFIRECPWNQFYDNKLQRCEYKHTCQKNLANLKRPASAHIRADYVLDDAIDKSLLDCKFLGNATVSTNACSQFFFECVSGVLYRKSCPDEFVYNLDQNVCDFTSKTQGCPDFEEVTTTPSYPFLDESSPKPVEQQYSANCSSRPDGFYELAPCQESFLSCTHETATIIPCAEKLVYDSRINACDYPEACRQKRTHEPIPNLFDHGGLLNENRTETKIDFNCVDKTDGHYTFEYCSSKYILCEQQRTFVMNCPTTLVYNNATKTCDYLENCQKASQIEETTTTQKPAQQEEFDFHCTDRADGQYSIGNCSTRYVSCENQQIIVLTCPSNLVYNEVKKICDYPEKCHSHPIASQNPETTTKPAPEPVTSETITISPCVNQVDGNYPITPCHTSFYQCINEKFTITKCPANLVFNAYQGQCDYRERSAGCKENHASPIDPTTTTTTVKPEVEIQRPPPPPPAVYQEEATSQGPVNIPLDPFCERLADGSYGLECNQFFFQCINFETFKIRCPSNLYYNSASSACDYKQNIAACKDVAAPVAAPVEVSATTTTAAPILVAPPAELKPYEQPATSVGAPSSQPAHQFSCFGRVDGIYAFPYCTSDYIQCVHGKALLSSCSSGLFYSEQTGLCDYRPNVENCNREQLAASQVEDTRCSTKSDGYYSLGCSSHYYSCTANRVRKLICPSNLKFSAQKGYCDYPLSIEECTKSSSPLNYLPTVAQNYCNGRRNGIHAFALCSPHYIVCDHGIATTGTCASPLVFNERNELCEYRYNNSYCPK